MAPETKGAVAGPQRLALNGLALRCEEVYGPGRDLEWAFADDGLVLLQCRAITKAGP